MKKRVMKFLLLLMLVYFTFSTVVIGFAAEKVSVPSVRSNVYVYDDDNIIDDNTESKLNKMLVQLEKKTTVEFAVVSVKSLGEMSIEDYGYKLFNALGIGKKDKNNGILLVFSRSDKRVRLQIGKGLEGCLNDGKCGRILDDYFVPYREKDDYTNACDYTVQATINALKSEYDFEIADLDEELTVSDKHEFKLDKSDIVFIVILLIIIFIIVFGGIFFGGGSDGGYYSGGSFSSGGSSFGGFGGGATGGGGASR